MWARSHFAPFGAWVMVIAVNYRHCAPPALVARRSILWGGLGPAS